MIARVHINGPDRNSARAEGDSAPVAFLRKLRPDGPWLLSSVAPDGPITTITTHTAADIDAFVRKHDGRANLYYSVNPTRRAMTRKASKSDIAAIEYALADLDPIDGETPDAAKQRYLDRLDSFTPKPTAVVDSGNGIQCLWRLEEPILLGERMDGGAVDDAEARNKALMLKLGAKPGTQDICRILRLPGTTNLPSAAKRKAGRVACQTRMLWFNGAAYPLSAFPTPAADELTRTIRDGGADRHGDTRSESVWFVCHEMLRRGHSDAAIVAVLLDRSNGISAHIYDQPGGDPAKCAQRQIDKARKKQATGPTIDPDLAAEQEAVLAELNDRYMLVNDNGTVLVYAERWDEGMKRHVYDYHKIAGLKELYANRNVRIVGADGRRITRNVVQFWREHPQRKQYIYGVVFDPSGKPAPDGVLNLWRGFAFQPKPGSWRRLRAHIRDNICRGNQEHFDYLFGWMASMVKNPGQRGEVAVVLRGGIGTGKGTLGHALRELLGQHGFYITSANHLIGKFNAHLRDCVFLFADEAFYAGDRAHTGILKGIITEPVLTIEPKMVNAFQSPNRLHILMASNSDWVVPAGIDERRFFVLDVSGRHAKDFKYFAAIKAELEAGGYAAMLYDLLHYDLDGYEIRDVPETKALQEQKKHGLDTTHAWWLEILSRGHVYQSQYGLDAHFDEWQDTVATVLLHKSYETFARSRGERRPMVRELLGKFLRKSAGARATRPRGEAVIGEHYPPGGPQLRRGTHVPSYRLGTLELARKDFEELTGITFDWK